MSSETENRIVEKLDELNDKFDRLDRTITGGDDPGKGMIVRIDRLEQARAATGKWLALIGTAAAGAVATGIWRLIKP